MNTIIFDPKDFKSKPLNPPYSSFSEKYALREITSNDEIILDAVCLSECLGYFENEAITFRFCKINDKTYIRCNFSFDYDKSNFSYFYKKLLKIKSKAIYFFTPYGSLKTDYNFSEKGTISLENLVNSADVFEASLSLLGIFISAFSLIED